MGNGRKGKRVIKEERGQGMAGRESWRNDQMKWEDGMPERWRFLISVMADGWD